MDNAVEVAQDVATSPSRAAFLQALEDRDSELRTLIAQHTYEISRIQDEQRALRTQYNAVAPHISRLPPELLSLIFQAFVDDYWDADYGNTYMTRGSRTQIYRTSMCGWLFVLHVCHHWRSVALGTPSLWSRIELGCEPYVELALKHSGEQPLKIFAGRARSDRLPRMDAYNSATVIQHLPPVFSRLHTVQLRVANPVIKSALESLYDLNYGLQAPMLKTLIIILNIDQRIDSIPILSNLGLPNLTSLEIENGSLILLQSFVRPTLTTLDVKFSPACTPSAMVHTLEQLPLLQHLKLTGFQQDVTPVPVDMRTPSWCHTISLPFLKSIHFQTRSRARDLVHLLCCLEFPADTQITLSIVPGIDMNGHPVVNDDTEQLLPLVLSKALVSNTLTRTEANQVAIPRVIELRSQYTSALEVALWSKIRPYDLDSSITRAAAVKRLDLIGISRKKAALVRLFQPLDLSEVVVLDIKSEIFAETWMPILQNRTLPKLRDLMLTGITSVKEVLSVISTPIRTSQASSLASTDNNGEEGRSYLLPTVKTLILSSCTFRRKPQKTLRTDLLPFILRALRVRAKHGCKLEKLIIRWPINLTRERDMAALRDPRIADYVEIGDGKEESWTSSEDDEEEDEHALELALEA
ncbi:hypothetical protein EIP86_011128 [Pleurotus ostreatoroseus]|nr:hypothetical protein EIP86_011128 [Pleurotus ostreatoroseus]